MTNAQSAMTVVFSTMVQKKEVCLYVQGCIYHSSIKGKNECFSVNSLFDVYLNETIFILFNSMIPRGKHLLLFLPQDNLNQLEFPPTHRYNLEELTSKLEQSCMICDLVRLKRYILKITALKFPFQVGWSQQPETHEKAENLGKMLEISSLTDWRTTHAVRSRCSEILKRRELRRGQGRSFTAALLIQGSWNSESNLGEERGHFQRPEELAKCSVLKGILKES